MPQPQEFRFQIWKGLAGTSLGLLWLTASLLMMAMRAEAPDPVEKNDLFTVLGLNVLMGLALLIVSLHLLIDRRPVMQFDARGITDLRFSPDPVPWEAIAGWHKSGWRTTTHLVLHFDPISDWYLRQQAAQDRPGRRFVRILHPKSRQLGAWLGASTPSLHLPVLGLPKRHLFKAIETWRQTHRPSTPADT